MRQSDLTINYIVRGIIQTGCLATAWALAALATFFLLPKVTAYMFFNITSGTIYTHVSSVRFIFHLFRLIGVVIFKAMFETLLSRIRLRERLKLPSYINVKLQVCRRGLFFLLTTLHTTSILN